MKSDEMTVAVTGAAGYLASRLIRDLCDDERVARVLGFDLRPPRFSSDRFVFDALDVRDPELRRRLEDVDVVVHLAFIMDPIKDEAHMRDVNVKGSRNVFECAAAAGVGQIVYTSSAVAYGAHPDNDFPLTEESPLRANLDFSYPAHKLEVEYEVRDLREEHPEIAFTLFRPAIVYGPHVDNAWSHLLEGPMIFGVAGHRPPFQFVHETDVTRALSWAIGNNELDGAFNLAPRGWLDYDEALEMIGRRRAELSEPAAFKVVDCLWRIGLFEAPPGMLHYVMHPWVMSTDKLARAGFVCESSNSDSLTEAVAMMRDHVRIGRVRLRKADVRNLALAATGAVAAATIAGSARRMART